jgi:glycosyltransferase involved in cell wall biosynthesis
MKVIQAVGWYYPDSLGGTEVYVAGLCRRLRAAKEEVLVAAPDAAHVEERSYEYDGVQVYRYPIPSSTTRAESQGLLPVRGAERFHRWLARLRPDVVHFHTFVTGLGLHEVKAAKATGARIIATSHSSSLGWICQRGTMMRWGERLCDGLAAPAKCAACALQHRGLAKPLARVLGGIPPTLGRTVRSVPGKLGTALAMGDLIARNQEMQHQMVTLVDKFVLLTAWALEAAAANGAPREKLALNRLGLSHARPVPKPGAEERPTKNPIKVGYLGRFEAIKGVCDLARAAASLPCDIPLRVEFRGPVTSEAEKGVVNDVKRLAAGDPRIAFAPPVPQSEVLQVLAGYDVLCCPSLCLEGGPTVAIEAHAVGTPVIGTQIGGLAELVADGVNGQLVVPGDWRALAGVLRAMARDPLGTIDRWRRALTTVRTMDQVAAEYLTLYTA